MVRSIAGHGRSIARYPALTRLPASSLSDTEMPGKGRVALPGVVAVTPGSGVIIIPPVSVCHQVSMMGQRPAPMVSWYQIQASGLIGSPTVPSRRSCDRSWPAGHSSPHFMKARMAVGAV